MFLRDVWYAAAWTDELEEQKPFARTIADIPLVFWRTAGQVSALLDRCPHRFAPLSLGRLEDGNIRCRYHGLKFGSSGACVENPHGPLVSALRVASYPTVERYGLVWVWTGTASQANKELIPDLSFINRAAQHAFSKGYLPTAADHRLLVDNILDLSHADFLHPDTLGGGSITRTRASVENRGDTVFVQWLVKNEPALPIFRPELPRPDMLTDMWTEVLWYPSGAMLLRVGATPAGCRQEEGIDSYNAHIMTPETQGRTHYFYCNSRNYRTDDEEYNRLFASGLRAAFELEDKPMIEAQQRRIGAADLMQLKPALMANDLAAMRARQVYDRLLAAEAHHSQNH